MMPLPCCAAISIHAPRGGSDRKRPSISFLAFISIHASQIVWANRYFNPRSPWGERRGGLSNCMGKPLFQSTLPVGGATRRSLKLYGQTAISIHAPRGGSDAAVSQNAPRGGSDRRSAAGRPFASISIHAPRGGSDSFDFNPRSPWGERLISIS